MSTILNDFSPAQLCAAIDANITAWIPEFGRLGQYFDDRPPGVKRSITDIPLSLFNSVMDAHLEPGEVEAAIQTVIADARLHKVPVLWWVSPNTRPEDLGNSLERAGFSLDDDGPGMAVDLDQVNENIPPVPGLSIDLVVDEFSRCQWSRILAIGFEAPSSIIELFENHWCHFLKQADPKAILAYTGLLEGQPVATSLLFLGAGVAGIYAVSTIPAARRKGIGAQMTLHPLLQARALGYRVGILQSSPMGIHVYHSLGFKDYCQIKSYRWKPEE